jgi:hypothetical protein
MSYDITRRASDHSLELRSDLICANRAHALPANGAPFKITWTASSRAFDR